MRDLALFLHLLGVVLFAAGIVVAGVAFEAARRRERPAEIALLLGVTRVGVALVAAGAVMALAFGLWLVHLEHLSYGAGWIQRRSRCTLSRSHSVASADSGRNGHGC